MRGALRHLLCRVVAVCVGVLALGAIARAQEQPVLFIHGVGSGPDTWQEAADRLQSRLRIAPERAQVSWWTSLESQSSELQARFGGWPNSSIAVGHSLGGLVARQWSRSHELDGLITLGTPNRGAPIANHGNEWVGFNSALFGAVGNVFYWLGNVSYDQWWWVYSAVEGALNWGGFIADFSIYHLLVEMGLQYGVPFVQEVYVGSPYLDALNNGIRLGSRQHPLPRRHRQHGERVLARRAVQAQEPRLRG